MPQKHYLFLLPILGLLCAGANPSNDSVLVHGVGIADFQWTTEQARFDAKKEKQWPMSHISYELRGEKHTALASSLLGMSQEAGLDTKVQMGQAPDARKKNAFLHLAVLVIGRDGYAAVFGVADLMPNFGNKQVWIAWDMDGKPLDDRHAPAVLIVPDDAKPERWIRGVVEIRLIDTDPAPSTQPAVSQ